MPLAFLQCWHSDLKNCSTNRLCLMVYHYHSLLYQKIAISPIFWSVKTTLLCSILIMCLSMIIKVIIVLQDYLSFVVSLIYCYLIALQGILIYFTASYLNLIYYLLPIAHFIFLIIFVTKLFCPISSMDFFVRFQFANYFPYF